MSLPLAGRPRSTGSAARRRCSASGPTDHRRQSARHRCGARLWADRSRDRPSAAHSRANRIDRPALGGSCRACRPGRRGHRVVGPAQRPADSKTRVPLGVVFFIYESRPNVTADAAAICVKSGNAVILRGGKEAVHSSRAIVELLCETLRRSRPAGRRRAARRARPTARPSGTSCDCPNTSTWPFPAAAKA